MRTIKRFTSVLLVFAMLIALLCSCEVLGENGIGDDTPDVVTKASAEEIVTAAESALKANPYIVNMTIKYSSDDEAMQSAIKAFGTPKVKTEVNGDSFRISMSFTKGGVESGITYTYLDGVLYTDLNEAGLVTGDYEDFTDADKAELTESLGAGANISIDDFSKVIVIDNNGKSVINCGDIKDEPLEKLVASLQAEMGEDILVAIKNATLVITTDCGKYTSTVFTCDYVITTPDNAYNLTMTYTSNFTYGKNVVITAP